MAKSTKKQGIKRENTRLDILMAENNIRTDKDLSELLGLSQQNFSQKINNNITTDTLIELSDYFGITVKNFLR